MDQVKISRRSVGIGGLARRAGIGAVFMAMLVGSLMLGCRVVQINPRACSNHSGDAFCALRHGEERRFCLYGRDECIAALPPELRMEPEFDGCVEVRPADDCYSPCGRQLSAVESGECIGGTAGDSGSEGGALQTMSETSDETTISTSLDITVGDSSSTGGGPECGNGLVEDGEECDDRGESEECDDDCTNVTCGDGTANAAAGEECDDRGESVSCDGDCTEAECGDGVVNITRGEVCDGDGMGIPGETEWCDVDCTFSECGDGVVNQAAGEECDDGGVSANCNLDCTRAAFCGNGMVEPGEECDGSDLGGTSCISLGCGGSGTPVCEADCTFNACEGCI